MVFLAAIISFFQIAGVGNISFAQHGMPPQHPVTQEKKVVYETATLPTVESVQLAIKKATGDTLPPLTLPCGVSTNVPGTDVDIIVSDFYTCWKWNDRPINKTFDEQNPAIKVDVFKSDSLLYSRWAFMNMPFFGLQGALGHSGEAEKDLGFTLIEYTGLEIPADISRVTVE